MERPPNEVFTHIAMSGEKEKGEGIVFIDIQSSAAKYLTMDEIQPKQFKEKVEEFMNIDGNTYFYMVQKDESNLHVFKTQRAMAIQQLMLTNSSKE